MALISVILVSLLLSMLLVITVSHQQHAATSSARDRNFDLALGVAEAGIQEAVAKIQASGGGLGGGDFEQDLPQGSYSVSVTRSPGKFVLQSKGSVGNRLGRSRVVRVTLEPPRSFRYVLFANTFLDVKNNDEAEGDIWANESVTIDENAIIDGAVTAATGWVSVAKGTEVKKDVWSGGYYPSGWAISLANGAKVGGSAKAGVSEPGCVGELSSNYQAALSAQSVISGNLTTWGTKSGPGSVSG